MLLQAVLPRHTSLSGRTRWPVSTGCGRVRWDGHRVPCPRPGSESPPAAREEEEGRGSIPGHGVRHSRPHPLGHSRSEVERKQKREFNPKLAPIMFSKLQVSHL